MEMDFIIGRRIRISSQYHWAKKATGEITKPPDFIKETADGWKEIVRKVRALNETLFFYWVRFNIPLQVTTWDAKPYDETTENPTLSRILVKKTFDGEVKGESTGELLMCASQDGAAGYTIMDRFFVEFDGRKGSFVAVHGGMTDEMKALGKIVPGSGTNDLKGISGTLEFKSDESGKRIILNYSFEDER